MILAVELEIVDLADIRARMRDDPGLAGRVLTDDERAWCLAQSDPAPGLAARLAAKTAVLRALGLEPAPPAWHDVEIIRDPSGKPSLRLTGVAAGTADARDVVAMHVSLTHARDQAAAAIVFEG